MSDFAQGAAVGAEVKKQNPLNTILSSFQAAQARRYKEDQARKTEEAELSKALMVLQYKDNYDRELAKENVKAEKEKSAFGEQEKRKTGLLESIRKGEVASTTETGAGTFEGTPFGAVGERFKTGESKEARTIKNQDLSRATQLRKEFIDRPEVKEFVSIRNKVASMDSLLKNALNNNNASRLSLDQGLITLYNKITDPNSVVRESEYERTPTNLSLANRFSGAIEKIQKGGAGITNEDRKSLVWGAKIIANAQGKMFNEKIDQYSKIASDYGVDPDLVISGMTPHSEFNMTDEQQKQSEKSFTSEQEALNSGYKGIAIINGRKARID